jgi:hypothetical protein
MRELAAVLVSFGTCTSGTPMPAPQRATEVPSLNVSVSTAGPVLLDSVDLKEEPPAAPRPRPPLIETPIVETMASYIQGYPMPMAMTVTLPLNVDLFMNDGRVPPPPLDMPTTFTRVSDGAVTKGGREFTGRLSPRFAVEPDDVKMPFIDLEPGEPRRLLFDAALLQGDSPLEAGSYRVELSYRKVPAPPFAIVVREPTSVERVELRRMQRLDSDWVTSLPSGSAPLPILPEDPFRYMKVLNFLYTTPTPLNQLDLRFLKVLDGFFAPEAMLLRFELGQLRKDEAAQESAEQAIRSQYPSSIPALMKLKQVGGYIPFYREQQEWSRLHGIPR